MGADIETISSVITDNSKGRLKVPLLLYINRSEGTGLDFSLMVHQIHLSVYLENNEIFATLANGG